VIAVEAGKLSQKAKDYLLAAEFNGVCWTSSSTTTDITEELTKAKAVITIEGGLKITNRGMVYRYHLTSVTHGKMLTSK
jgi:phosphohistidine swiveling domain-containing protein